MKHKNNVVIVGGGFCGMMTAVYLLRSNQPINITIINDGYPFPKGIAFNAHTEKYLLNVRAVNMSAFADDKLHFLHWLKQHPSFKEIPDNILLNVYAPRKLYGDYLEDTWINAINDKHPHSNVYFINQRAENIIEHEHYLSVHLNNKESVLADYIVLATGNPPPRDIFIQNKSFLKSDKYFGNPWSENSVQNVRCLNNILIAGNGLTMVDTLLGLLENGFKGTIYTVSPNGFKLIPHKYNLMVYEKIAAELPEKIKLKELFILIRTHIRSLTKVGIGSHLVIDALRPFTQQIWQGFSLQEKKYFIKRLSHAWSVLRHRIPIHIYEMIQQLRMQQRMIPLTGRIKDITEQANSAIVLYFNEATKKTETIEVDRIINCTGPESDIRRSANGLLRNLVNNDIITPDELHLGIEADAAMGAVKNSKGDTNERIFTTGSNLKGVLWENTAVPDIRQHVKKMTLHISNQIRKNNHSAVSPPLL